MVYTHVYGHEDGSNAIHLYVYILIYSIILYKNTLLNAIYIIYPMIHRCHDINRSILHGGQVEHQRGRQRPPERPTQAVLDHAHVETVQAAREEALVQVLQVYLLQNLLTTFKAFKKAGPEGRSPCPS